MEHAQRIGPDLNAIDVLALAYYLKHCYDVAAVQAQLNLRRTEDAHFSYVVLAAAYAQLNRSKNAAHVVTIIHWVDTTFDAFLDERAVLIRLTDVYGKVLPEKSEPHRSRLLEDKAHRRVLASSS